MQTDFGYTGQRNIADIGLIDYHARMYDAAIGKFIQPNTVIPSAADPQTWNRYAYVYNDPISLIDPTGNAGHCRGSSNYSCKRRLARQNSITRKSTAADPWAGASSGFSSGSITLSSLMNESSSSSTGDNWWTDGGNSGIPSWDPAFSIDVTERDKEIAVTAYLHFLSDPNLFAEYFVNPRNAPLEYDALELFAEYSTLHTTANQLIWNSVATRYGMSAAEALDNAQLHNVEVVLSKDLLHVGGDALALWIITFGHGARHLAGLNVTQEEVEAAIRANVELNVDSASTGLYKGSVTVNGIEIEYHAFPQGNNKINIGTYFPPEDKR